jgi:hypothetical protein
VPTHRRNLLNTRSAIIKKVWIQDTSEVAKWGIKYVPLLASEVTIRSALESLSRIAGAEN